LGDEKKNEEVNGRAFTTFINLVQEMCPNIKHINLQTGNKYYGAHLGPFKTPACEFDPRPTGPNFYFLQEDTLKKVCASKGITYCILRPSDVIGFSTGKQMMLGCSIALYGSLCKLLGKKMIFPGSEEYWNAIVDNTDSNLLARAHVHCSLTNECGNKIFNVSNGEVFRWKYIWPLLASYFGVEWEGPQKDPNNPNVHLTLTKILDMMDAHKAWNNNANEAGLREKDLSNLITPQFVDSLFSRKWDVFSNTALIRMFGFKDFIPTELSYFRLFDQLKEHNVIPKTLPQTPLKYTTNINELCNMIDLAEKIEVSVIKRLGAGEGSRIGRGVEAGVPLQVEKEE
jgi:hypothetical protein